MEREKIFYCHTIFNRKVMQAYYNIDINQSIFSSETILRLGLLFLQTIVSKNWEAIYIFRYFSEYVFTHIKHFNLSLLSK